MDLMQHITRVEDFPVPGIDFKDITTLLESPAAFGYCIDRLTEIYTDEAFDKIVAFGARGFLFGAPMAYRLAKPLVLFRKQGKLPRETASTSYQGEYAPETIEIHRSSVEPGDRLVLVDDVSADGECFYAACKLLEGMGAEVHSCAVLIQFLDLGSPERLAGYRVNRLLGVRKGE